MFFRIPRIAALFALSAVATAAPTQAPSVFGRWVTDDGKALVQVAKCGDKLCGTILKLLDPASPRQDIHNPSTALRGRPLEGTQVLSGLSPASDGGWRAGTAYDPKTGSSYRASAKLGAGGTLDVTGCVLFVCQTRHWTRAR